MAVVNRVKRIRLALGEDEVAFLSGSCIKAVFKVMPDGSLCSICLSDGQEEGEAPRKLARFLARAEGQRLDVEVQLLPPGISGPILVPLLNRLQEPRVHVRVMCFAEMVAHGLSVAEAIGGAAQVVVVGALSD